jgi:hypothetical protein
VSVRLIGFWRDGIEGDWPDPHDFVDAAWDARARDLVAGYLEQGFIRWVAAGFSECRLCGRANGSAEFTDGVYLWPEGLAHYVRDHSVRLPDEVVAYITHRWDELASLEVEP